LNALYDFFAHGIVLSSSYNKTLNRINISAIVMMIISKYIPIEKNFSFLCILDEISALLSFFAVFELVN